MQSNKRKACVLGWAFLAMMISLTLIGIFVGPEQLERFDMIAGAMMGIVMGFAVATDARQGD